MKRRNYTRPSITVVSMEMVQIMAGTITAVRSWRNDESSQGSVEVQGGNCIPGNKSGDDLDFGEME